MAVRNQKVSEEPEGFCDYPFKFRPRPIFTQIANLFYNVKSTLKDYVCLPTN